MNSIRSELLRNSRTNIVDTRMYICIPHDILYNDVLLLSDHLILEIVIHFKFSVGVSN